VPAIMRDLLSLREIPTFFLCNNLVHFEISRSSKPPKQA
jgi:hypothetical protein